MDQNNLYISTENANRLLTFSEKNTLKKENYKGTSTQEVSKETENHTLFESLKRAETGAIQQLAVQITPGTRRAALNARLSLLDAEELVNDALVITINNIRKGSFQFQNFTAAAYANGVVRKLIANRIRTKKPSSKPLSGFENIADFSPEEYLQKKEKEQYIGKLFAKLGDTCRKVLHLKYFENLRDQEIISKAMTSFTSINSLKSKRSQCLKKLVTLAKANPLS